VSDRNRRALADGLRRAAATPPPRLARFDPCPILRARVAAVRPELLEIARGLEQAEDPDPTCVALIAELLGNACGPLYNDNVPSTDLHATLRRASLGLESRSPAEVGPAPRRSEANRRPPTPKRLPRPASIRLRSRRYRRSGA
jgi:hypothetical protein